MAVEDRDSHGVHLFAAIQHKAIADGGGIGRQGIGWRGDGVNSRGNGVAPDQKGALPATAQGKASGETGCAATGVLKVLHHRAADGLLTKRRSGETKQEGKKRGAFQKRVKFFHVCRLK